MSIIGGIQATGRLSATIHITGITEYPWVNLYNTFKVLYFQDRFEVIFVKYLWTEFRVLQLLIDYLVVPTYFKSDIEMFNNIALYS